MGPGDGLKPLPLPGPEDQLPAGEAADRLRQLQPPQFPLDKGCIGPLAVLGRHAHRLHAAVVQGQHAAGVHPPLEVGTVADLPGRTEQGRREVDVVHIQIHQRAPGHGGVKGGGRLPLQERVVAGGVLTEVQPRQPQGTQPGHLLPQGQNGGQVVERHGLRQHQPPPGRQPPQLPELGEGGDGGLLHQHMEPLLQGPPGVRIVEAVGQGHVDRVRPALQDLLIPEASAGDPIPGRQGLRPLPAALRAQNGVGPDAQPLQHRQRLLDDLACAQNSKPHGLSSSFLCYSVNCTAQNAP